MYNTGNTTNATQTDENIFFEVSKLLSVVMVSLSPLFLCIMCIKYYNYRQNNNLKTPILK